MRLRCRIIPPHRAILLAFLIVASAFVSPAFAQSGTEPPAVWTNTVRGLADKIAAAAGTTRNISLDVRNISSLSPSDANVAQKALESELTQRHFRIVPAASATSGALSEASAQVRVTFSEGIN